MNEINKKLLDALEELVDWVKTGDYEPSFLEKLKKQLKKQKKTKNNKL